MDVPFSRADGQEPDGYTQVTASEQTTKVQAWVYIRGIRQMQQMGGWPVRVRRLKPDSDKD